MHYKDTRRARRPRVQIICPVCSARFLVSRATREDGNGKYCCRACYIEARFGGPVADRFWPFVERRGPNECWPWRGGFTGMKQYGAFTIRGTFRNASAVAWELENNRPVPEGMLIRHVVCDNPACCNPAHLAVGTHLDNMADRNEKGRQARGERHARTQLTADAVRELRRIHATSHDPHKTRILAVRYGISVSSVTTIVNRLTWKHVP